MRIEELSEVHQRLLEGDPTAPSDLFAALYCDLIAFLRGKYPSLAAGIDEDIYNQAAFSAMNSYIQSPEKYDPQRSNLRSYLRMSARGDLLNLMKREGRRRHSQVNLDDVADRTAQGNRESEGLEAEYLQRAIDSLRHELGREDALVLDLLIEGERRTQAFAEALGIEDWPLSEQRRQVNRIKDRIKKRFKRRGVSGI